MTMFPTVSEMNDVDLGGSFVFYLLCCCSNRELLKK